MKRRQPAVITVSQHRHSGVVRGPVRVIHPAIQKLGIRWQWDPRSGCYLVPLRDRAELEAALTADGHIVQVAMFG